MHQNMERIDFLCFDLAQFNRTLQFLILTGLTFIFFLLYGFLQELIYELPGFEEFPWYLTLVQFFLYACFAYTERRIRNDHPRKIPLKTYFLLALLTVATMGLSNASVPHLNYPTQVMFKCCKLIPVLLGGILIQGKVFNMYDVSASIMMSIGLIFFTLADIKVQPDFELTGFVYILFGEMFFDKLPEAIVFWLKHPMKTYGYAFIFSLTGYLGINIVLHLVKNFGALIAVTVTTCRKAVTIAVSFIFFTKPFTYQYLWAGLLVSIGIYLNLFSKNREKWENTFLKFYNKLIYFINKKNRFSDESNSLV